MRIITFFFNICNLSPIWNVMYNFQTEEVCYNFVLYLCVLRLSFVQYSCTIESCITKLTCFHSKRSYLSTIKVFYTAPIFPKITVVEGRATNGLVCSCGTKGTFLVWKRRITRRGAFVLVSYSTWWLQRDVSLALFFWNRKVFPHLNQFSYILEDAKRIGTD